MKNLFTVLMILFVCSCSKIEQPIENLNKKSGKSDLLMKLNGRGDEMILPWEQGGGSGFPYENQQAYNGYITLEDTYLMINNYPAQFTVSFKINETLTINNIVYQSIDPHEFGFTTEKKEIFYDPMFKLITARIYIKWNKRLSTFSNDPLVNPTPETITMYKTVGVYINLNDKTVSYF